MPNTTVFLRDIAWLSFFLLSESRIAASLQEIQYISAFIPEFIVDSMIGQVTEITVFSYQSFIHAKY